LRHRYDAIWHRQLRRNGIAFLSPLGEIHETRYGPHADPDERRSRYIEAAVRR
jgi:hypothetical protein